MKIETSDILGVIPERFNSTRLLGKPLKLIGDKPMIQHVYERTKKTLNNVIVSTDDDRIFNCIKDIGGKVILTKENHENGTSRCLEAVNIYRDETGTEYKYIVNIQGDEPFFDFKKVENLIGFYLDEHKRNNNVKCGTLFYVNDDYKYVSNKNRVKLSIENN